MVSVPLLAALLVAREASALACQVPVEAREERPNVVLVVFDDLDLALSTSLPGWRAIEERSLRFSNAFVTSPLCCPSRASILTGQYAHSHGIHTNSGPMGGYHRGLDLRFERCTLPVWLDQAGYETYYLGKYLNNYGFDADPRNVPAGWDHWSALWARTPFTGYTFNMDGRLEAGAGYQTDELASRAADIVSSARGPFFLMLAPFVPHRPWNPPDRYVNAHVPEDYSRPNRYRAMLAGVDLLNEVIAALPPNTYLIVTSDNGYHFEPTPGKATPSEADTRVPLFVLGPGVEPGERDELVANIDLAPTIAAWAGVSPANPDGMSLAGLVAGEDVAWRSSILLEMVGEWSARQTLFGLEDLRGAGEVEADDE